MIQRFQSILLALALVSSALLYFEPVFTWTANDGTSAYTLGVLETAVVSNHQQERLTLNIPLILINALILVFSLITLVGFKNRVKQARFCHLLLLMQLILISYIFYDWDQVTDLAGQGFEWRFSMGLIFLAVPVLLFPLARYYILKDEALVRSSDRLR